jgi:8-oxo-dGTP diphosphatase
MEKGLIVHTLLFNEKGEFLILKRSKYENVLPEYWDIPGGTLKDGEDPISGAIRETKEEAGIEIDNLNLFCHTSNIDPVKNKQFIRLIFIAFCQKQKITVNPEEHEEYAWIKASNVSDYKTVDYLPICLKTLEKNQIKQYFSIAEKI